MSLWSSSPRYSPSFVGRPSMWYGTRSSCTAAPGMSKLYLQAIEQTTVKGERFKRMIACHTVGKMICVEADSSADQFYYKTTPEPKDAGDLSPVTQWWLRLGKPWFTV